VPGGSLLPSHLEHRRHSNGRAETGWATRINGSTETEGRRCIARVRAIRVDPSVAERVASRTRSAPRNRTTEDPTGTPENLWNVDAPSSRTPRLSPTGRSRRRSACLSPVRRPSISAVQGWAGDRLGDGPSCEPAEESAADRRDARSRIVIPMAARIYIPHGGRADPPSSLALLELFHSTTFGHGGEWKTETGKATQPHKRNRMMSPPLGPIGHV
jgi:hypothetical protein